MQTRWILDEMTASAARFAEPLKSGLNSAGQDTKILVEDRNRDLRLGFLIHDVSRMRKRAFDEFVKPLGVTRSQWWIIGNLSRHDGLMQSQLASLLDVGKASLGMVLDRLETNGLVERRPHPVDRRAKCVFMTEKAHQLIAKMLSVERAYDDIVLGELSSEDRDQLVKFLELIKKSLNKFELGADASDDHSLGLD